jgi:hypothetical protein
MKDRKLLISALTPLRPINIWDATTGEAVNPTVFEKNIDDLVSFVQEEVEHTFITNPEKVIEDASNLTGSANSYARQLGYSSGSKELPREILAKSRINELFLHKLMSEVGAYAKNDNPDKEYPTFPKTINLGAVNHQMASLSKDGDTLTLLWKCWSREYLIDFRVPAYVLKRNIAKFSLPIIRYTKKGYEFIFTIKENIPELASRKLHAGLDLGRVEPYVVAVVNGKGNRVAHYTTNGRLKKLNAKREQILKHKHHVIDKIEKYEKLGLTADVLVSEKTRLANKAKILGNVVAQNMGAEISNKLAKHALNTLHVENLVWATGVQYGSKWNHSRQQDAIAHALLRNGTRVKKINPKDSSQKCHQCGTALTHTGRKVRCAKCQLVLDRDYNAALNLASKRHLNKRYPNLINGLVGDDCSPIGQVIDHVDPSSVIKLVT